MRASWASDLCVDRPGQGKSDPRQAAASPAGRRTWKRSPTPSTPIGLRSQAGRKVVRWQRRLILDPARLVH